DRATKAKRVDDVVELKVRIAGLSRKDPTRAIPLLKDVLKAKPGHREAVEALEDFMRPGAPGRAEAAAILEPLYENEKDYAKLAEALDARVSVQPSAAERVALLHRLTELQAGPLWNPRAAFSAASRALTELPDDAKALQNCLQWHEIGGATDE